MKNLSLILLIGLFVSCRSVKTVDKVYESQKDSISYVDRVIVDTLKIPGEKIEIELPCGEDLKPQSFAQGRAKVKAEPKGNGYTIIVTCDSIEKIVLSREREIKHLKAEVKTLESKKEKGLTLMQSFWIGAGKFLSGLLLLILVFKFAL